MSERERLTMIASMTASSAAPVAPSVAPDPEVGVVATRGQFKAAYNLCVLAENLIGDRAIGPPQAIKKHERPNARVNIRDLVGIASCVDYRQRQVRA